jgi:hypothetical protein
MNRFNTAARLSSLALILASSPALLAQASESGQFAGKVLATDGKPIAGATITIRGEKLIGAKTARSDADGSYRIMLLPPGEYVLTVTAPNFVTAKNSTPLRLGLGAALRQDWTLKPIATASAVVEVVAFSATMDKADNKTAMNISAETLSALPVTNRGFEGGMDLSPGVSSGPGGQTYTASIRGGTTQSAVYTLNGTSVGEDVSGMSPLGQGNVFFVEDSIEDMQVVLSPLHARYGRTSGGMINMATKSGGNDFQGSVRKYIARNDWGSNSPGTPSQVASTDQYGNRKTDILISGPIWKDHIWFVASTILSPTVGVPTTLSVGTQPSTWGLYTNPTSTGKWTNYAWAPGTAPASPTGIGSMTGWDFNQGKTVNSQEKSTFWQFKLTYAITQDHTISYEKSNNDDQTKNAGFNGGGTLANLGDYQYPQGPKNWYQAYNYKGALSSKLYVEAIFSDKHWTHTNGPMVPFPHVREYMANAPMIWPYGTNANTSSLEDNANKNGSINFKYILDAAGSHEIDWGYQYYESRHTTAGIAGPDLQRFYVYGSTTDPALLAAAGMTTPDRFGRLVGFLAGNYVPVPAVLPAGSNGKALLSPTGGSGGVAPGYRKYIGVDGVHANRNGGYYVNDSWAPDSHWNVGVGLRIEKVRDTNTDGRVMLDYWSSLSPRLSVKYDPKGDSAHVFSGSIARFTQDITAGTTSNWVTSPGNAYVNYGWKGGTFNAAGLPVATWVSEAALENVANYDLAHPISQVNNSAGTIGLDKLRSPYVVEVSAGYRRNRPNGSYFQINVTEKDWHRDVAQAQWGNDPTYWTQSQLVPQAPPQTTLSLGVLNSPDIHRTYRGLELEFKENFTQNMTFGGSYTYSRLTGNDNGGDTYNSPFKGSGLTSSAVTWANEYYTFRDVQLANGWKPANFDPYGTLLGDNPQKARLYISYNQPLGTKGGKISYSVMMRYDSGSNYSATSGYNAGNSSSDMSPFVGDAAPLKGAPTAIDNASFVYYSSARGAFHQNDSYSIDLTMDFLAPTGIANVMLMGNLKLVNLFNTQLLVNYDNAFAPISNANVTVDPTHLVANSVSAPSTFGTGLMTAATGAQNPGAYNYGRYITASIGIKF